MMSKMSILFASSHHVRDDKSSRSGSRMNCNATSKISSTESKLMMSCDEKKRITKTIDFFTSQLLSTTSPYPMSKRIIDKKWPQSDENEKCWKSHFLRPSTCHNDGNHQSKHHLKCNENKCRHTRCSSQTTIQWNVVKKCCVSCPSNDTTLWNNVRNKHFQT